MVFALGISSSFLFLNETLNAKSIWQQKSFLCNHKKIAAESPTA